MIKKRRFNKADWIALGLSQLSERGVEAIKLEAICKAAGLTRGSFYYHFIDHEKFLIEMVQNWGKTHTDDVAEQIGNDMSAENKATALTDASMQIDYRLELGIRELARRVPDAAKIVKETDAQRLEILSAIYVQRFGLENTQAKDLAYLEYAAFCGIILLDPNMARPRQHLLAALYDDLVQTSFRGR